MYDIIIIGAGPAGLSSAIYGKRFNKNILVIESTTYGGQIINALDIENYPALLHTSGFDFATNLYNQAKELGAEIIFEKVCDIKSGRIKKVITDKDTYKAKAIILATGCDNRKLNLLNEDKLLGKGISYCATCDGAFYKGKNVAIVGGGNTALEDALYLSLICKEVYLIHRRDTLRGDDKTISLLKEKENVHFIYNSNVTKINGNDKLESIIITNKNGENNELIIDGLFIAIGKIPNNDSFKSIIDLDINGYVKGNFKCHTNKVGIFAAGDIRSKEVRQLVTATSDGAIATIEAIKYLNNK